MNKKLLFIIIPAMLLFAVTTVMADTTVWEIGDLDNLYGVTDGTKITTSPDRSVAPKGITPVDYEDVSTFYSVLVPVTTITGTFDADLSEGATLLVSWSPGKSGTEQFSVTLGGIIMSSRTVTGAVCTTDPPDGRCGQAPSYYSGIQLPYYTEIFDFGFVGSGMETHTLSISYTQGDGMGFDYLRLLVPTTCPEGTSLSDVETVIVSSDGSTVSSTGSLKSGVTYLLEASGTFTYSSAGDWADAEWYLKSGVIVKGDTEGSKPYVLDISIDGYSTNRDWGDYNPEHIYTILFDGTGSTAGFSIYDSYHGDNSGSLTVDIYECVVPDSDNDGVPDTEDMCPETVIDTLTKGLGTNRWIWDGEKWDTKLPKGEGPEKTFTMEDTRGCSCSQILDTMGGKMMGHRKFGCSISVMEDFIANLQPVLVDTVNVDSSEMSGVNSIVLESGVNYRFEAMGTWMNGAVRSVDAQYISDDNWGTPQEGPFWNVLNLDLQIDEAFINWGSYSDVHTYYLDYEGTGSTVNFRVFDGEPTTNTPNPGWYGDNSGSLTVNIYRLP